jgi:hypothetical protein
MIATRRSMLKEPEKLLKAFQTSIRKSKKECKIEFDEMQHLINDVYQAFQTLEIVGAKKLLNSLVAWCYFESMRTSGQILYLAYCGLYRNAFDDIRHLLESIVQSTYIDANHPEADLKIKLEILKEIEDKKEYHASKIIENRFTFRNLKCKNLDCKGLLRNQYGELSQIVHPSHKKIISTIEDIGSGKGVPVTIDCSETKRILASLAKVYDILSFLVVANFPETKENLQKNTKLKTCIRKHKMQLLKKILSAPK